MMEKTNFEILMEAIHSALEQFECEDGDRVLIKAKELCDKLCTFNYFGLSDKVSDFIGEVANDMVTTKLSTDQLVDIHDDVYSEEKETKLNDFRSLMYMLFTIV